MSSILFEDAEPGMMGSAGASNTLQLGIDVVAILIGIFAVFVAIHLIRRIGGRINEALRYFIFGVACNAVAIFW